MEKLTLSVNDIFESIQGESLSTGFPTTFIRLYGCPVRCSYCDQPQDDFKDMTVNEIMEKVKKFHHTHVCLTGGEPLIHYNWLPLVEALEKDGFEVNIETSGCIPIADIPNRTWRYTMDIKTPSSGVSHEVVFSNLSRLKKTDEVKFVLKDITDFLYAKNLINSAFLMWGNRCRIIFSPVINSSSLTDEDKKWVRELVNEMLECPLFDNVRLQVQLHKVIGVK